MRQIVPRLRPKGGTTPARQGAPAGLRLLFWLGTALVPLSLGCRSVPNQTAPQRGQPTPAVQGRSTDQQPGGSDQQPGGSDQQPGGSDHHQCPCRMAQGSSSPGSPPSRAQAPVTPMAPPHAPLEMIAGFGLWPPVDKGEVRQQISAARADAVGRMVIDTGLTEHLQAYLNPDPHYEVIALAAAEAQRQGLAAAFYFPSFELRREKKMPGPQDLLRWRPAWAQITLDGRPLFKSQFGKQEFWNKAGDQALWVCPNSPWRHEYIQRMEQAARRGVATFLIDVPYFQSVGQSLTCRCRFCQARFKQQTGLQIPQAPRPGSLPYHRWLAWRHEVLAGFFGQLRQAIRRVNPAARLVVEEYPSYLPTDSTTTGLDIGLAGSEVDIFAHEYSAKQFDQSPYSDRDRLALATTLNLYRGLDAPRPTWVLSYAHDPAGSRINAAFHLCFDASFWETKAPEMTDTTVGRRWRRQLFDWVRRHHEVFGSSRQLAQVALIYSPISRDFTAAHFPTLQQAALRLTEKGIPYRVLSTRDLQQLPGYSAVILPAVGALKPQEAAALRRGPGRLLVVGQPPHLDQWGISKQQYHLDYQQVTLDQLPAALPTPTITVNGGAIAVNLLQRAGEIQLRLANLRDQPAQIAVTMSTEQPQQITALPLLGRPQKLAFKTQDGAIHFSVRLTDLVIIRLRNR